MKKYNLCKIGKATSINLQGSYTVEAAWIIAIALSVVGALITAGYDVFRDSVAITSTQESMVDVVKLFREGAVISDIFQDQK